MVDVNEMSTVLLILVKFIVKLVTLCYDYCLKNNVLVFIVLFDLVI